MFTMVKEMGDTHINQVGNQTRVCVTLDALNQADEQR